MSASKSKSASNEDELEEGRDEYGYTPLMNAIWEEDEDLAIELLETEELDLDAVNYEHFNAFQMACRKGLVNVALQMIDMGVDTHYIGGDGFKALDYAVAVKEHAAKIVAAADAQMKYAAEDEKWDDVCEWRSDKQKQKEILESIEPLIETLQNQDPDASMVISESDLKDSLESQLMRYLRNGRASKGLEWDPKGSVLTTLFFLHLMRTYRGSQCYVNDSKDEGYGIYLSYNFTRNHMVVSPDGSGDPEEHKRNSPKLKDIAAQIAKCLLNGKKSATNMNRQVIMPIIHTNAENTDFIHMNLLVFREKEWTLEHYEPHGKTNLFEDWSTKKGRQANEQIQEWLREVFEELAEHLNAKLRRRKMYKERGPVKLLMSTEICPANKGFQILNAKDKTFEKIGLCAVWSLFMAELAAAFPSLSLRQIQSAVFHKMQEYEMNMAGEFLLNIIKGYVLHIIESTRIYAEYLGVNQEEWTAKVFDSNPDLEERVSWLSWFESRSYYDEDFVKTRLKLYKQGSDAVTKEEWQNAERYLKMKRAQECASREYDSDSMIQMTPLKSKNSRGGVKSKKTRGNKKIVKRIGTRKVKI